MADVTRETLGKYEIQSVLGKGAMGTVYAAWDPIISRRVAIKTVRLPDASDIDAQEELARFKREAQAAGRLTHPNIVGIYDYGETDTVAYIVMEFVDGRTLKQILDGNQRLPIEAVGKVMTDLLCGLQFSHARGVVHRDIKPANLMIVGGDEGGGLGQAKIADFGIARIESSNLTQAGTIMGTPAYMSPEQFMGQTVDARTDLYSSGVLLFQMLTGERPFEGSMASIMHKALNTEPPRPSDLSVNVPRALDAVVSRAMARRPEDRFATADEFSAALRSALEGKGAVRAIEDSDATVVHAAPRPGTAGTGREAARDAARTAVRTEEPAPAGKRSSKAPLLAGVAVVVLAALGAGGWFLLQPGPTPPGGTGTEGSNQPTTPPGTPPTATQTGNNQPTTPPTQTANNQPTSNQTATPPVVTPPTPVQTTSTPPTQTPPTPTANSTATQTATQTATPTATQTATSGATSGATNNPAATTSPSTAQTASTPPGGRRVAGNLPRLDPAVTSTPQAAVTTAPTVAGSVAAPNPVQPTQPGPVVTSPSGPTVTGTSATPPVAGPGGAPPAVIVGGASPPAVVATGSVPTVAGSTSGSSVPVATSGSPPTVGGGTAPSGSVPVAGPTASPGSVPVATTTTPPVGGPTGPTTATVDNPPVTGPTSEPPGTRPSNTTTGNATTGTTTTGSTTTGNTQVAVGSAPEALRDAVATAVRSTSCSVLHGTLDPGGSLTVQGTIVAGPSVQAALRDLHEVAPGSRLRWSASEAIGPFCPVLDTVRGFAAPLAGAANALSIAPKTGRAEWIDGEVMTATLEAPAFPSYLQLDYFTRDDKGERYVLHVVSSTGPKPLLPAGERRTFDLGKAGSPFGTDVLVAISSSAPLFDGDLPQLEKQADYLPRLQTALDAARARDAQISADTSVVRTRKR